MAYNDPAACLYDCSMGYLAALMIHLLVVMFE